MGTFRFDTKGDICPNKTISFYRLVGKDGASTHSVVQRNVVLATS